MLDAGCGNGKYMVVNPHLNMRGVDSCPGLLAICRERELDVMEGNVLSLPVNSDSFDVCICVAVLHHLASPQRRLQAIREVVRSVRPGGQVG